MQSVGFLGVSHLLDFVVGDIGFVLLLLSGAA